MSSNLFRRVPFAQLAALSMLCASQAFGQVWTQLAPTGSPPPAGAGVGGLDQTNDRLVVVYQNGNPQTSWVLTNADGLGGTPQWLSFVTQPDPVYGPAPSRGELPTAVYDATSNRVITFGGCTGNCGSTTNDVWVLTNANGLTGTPSWLKLTPSGPLPQPRASHSAAYDSGSNRMIVFGGQDGCCAQQHSFGDVWVLTNVNGLGGTPGWIQLSPAGGPPAGQSEMRVVYDAANRMTVFGGWPYASNVPTNAVWVLSNANGLGGTPTWTNLIPEGSVGSPPGRGFQGAVFDPLTNRMTVFAGFAPPTSTLYNDTWTLSNANGIGPAAWTQVSTIGGPPGPRDFPLAVWNTSSTRMTIFGGGGATVSFNDVWVLGSVAAGRECDLNNDGHVNVDDINVIMAGRGTRVAPGDPRDVDGDGMVTTNDARACVLKCDKPLCAR